MNDWTGYCLAHLFTYQAFSGDVLGLAYVAENKLYVLGGICSRSSFKQRKIFSTNIGLSSYMSSSGKRLLQKESQLVTAHGIFFELSIFKFK